MLASTEWRVIRPSGPHGPSSELASKCLSVTTACMKRGSSPSWSPLLTSVPNVPQTSGSSDGVSRLRPQRGSRTMPILGDQQSRPRCGRLDGWFSPTPSSHRARSSFPITSAIPRQMVRLKDAPMKLGLG